MTDKIRSIFIFDFSGNEALPCNHITIDLPRVLEKGEQILLRSGIYKIDTSLITYTGSQVYFVSKLDDTFVNDTVLLNQIEFDYIINIV